MEPTNRRETGARPSAMKRYGPWIAIVVVIVLVGGGLLLFEKDDSKSTDNNAATTAGAVKTTGGPVTINDSNRSSINWGPNCDTKLGKVKIPYSYAAAVREAVHRRQRWRDVRGRHQGLDQDRRLHRRPGQEPAAVAQPSRAQARM